MKKSTQQQLVNGKFKTSEAKEIVHSLFKNKINFHTFAAFCYKEQTGIEAVSHNKRVRELNESLKAVIDLINQTSNIDGEININCDITITAE